MKWVIPVRPQFGGGIKAFRVRSGEVIPSEAHSPPSAGLCARIRGQVPFNMELYPAWLRKSYFTPCPFVGGRTFTPELVEGMESHFICPPKQLTGQRPKLQSQLG